MKSTSLVLGASILTFLGAGCNPQTATVQPQNAPVVALEGTIQPTDTATTTDALQTAGSYVAYSPETLSAAQRSGGRTVLFFHAKWCPSCKAADADFTTNLSSIPSGVTIIKTDYDTEKALKQQYGVTTQDTFVQVNGNGEPLARWNGGGEGMKSLLANLK